MPGIADYLEADNEEQQSQNDQNGQQNQGKISPQILQALEGQLRNKVMGEIMRDPEIAEIMRARVEKRKIKVINADEGGDNDDHRQNRNTGGVTDLNSLEDETDFDSMSNKQLAGFMLKQIKPLMTGAIKDMVTPLVQKIGQLEGYATQHQQQQVNQSVEQFRQRTPDFDTHAERMSQLSEQNPGLSVEQLYVLAKHASGQLVPKANIAASEQPTFAVGKSSNRQPKSHTTEAIRSLVRNHVAKFAEENQGEFAQ